MLHLVTGESRSRIAADVTKEMIMDQEATERRELVGRIKSALRNPMTIRIATAILRIVVFLARLIDWLH